jgi:hypothetical protein
MENKNAYGDAANSGKSKHAKGQPSGEVKY